MEITVDIVRR